MKKRVIQLKAAAKRCCRYVQKFWMEEIKTRMAQTGSLVAHQLQTAWKFLCRNIKLFAAKFKLTAEKVFKHINKFLLSVWHEILNRLILTAMSLSQYLREKLFPKIAADAVNFGQNAKKSFLELIRKPLRKRSVIELTAVLLCILYVFTVLPGPNASISYHDVQPNYWAYTAVTYLSDRGYLQGYAGNKFSPENSVTTAEFTAIACRMTGLDDTKLSKSAYWAEPDIQYALYMNWYTDKEIPYADYARPITRELATKIVMEAFFPDIVKTGETRSDIKINDIQEISQNDLKYIELAYTNGLLTGYGDGTFRPKDSISRAESAALLYRAWSKYQKSPKGSDSVTLPILLYHHIADAPGYTTPAKFREDMENLKKAGYTTIFYNELYDYVTNGKPLPAKPVVVSLDDGYYSNYQYAYPVLKELGMKAEISIIGCWVGVKNTTGVIPHFSWDESKEMLNADTIHIESHSYRMHDYDPSGNVTRYGVLKRSDENYQQYIYALSSDTTIITTQIEQNLGYVPLAYTYPNGFYTTLSDKILQSMGYKITLTTKVGVNTIIKGDTSSLMHLDRIAVDAFKGDVVALIKRSYF